MIFGRASTSCAIFAYLALVGTAWGLRNVSLDSHDTLIGYFPNEILPASACKGAPGNEDCLGRWSIRALGVSHSLL
ncbi:hypothetical protein AURDEDRAFT_116658 [Auricularia subglabra TFB-10046 SS5]|uniref:Uncharacterized protein n=1 Tax=Auricularia subglabra (strain TFB-10046 / SS5) TaxID=717982 RepID=J0WWG5_AURST|nr:hypothetical protein AURDEDRAFT_116658 [Auricularia subglabra TFB-10046 SS5]